MMNMSSNRGMGADICMGRNRLVNINEQILSLIHELVTPPLAAPGMNFNQSADCCKFFTTEKLV